MNLITNNNKGNFIKIRHFGEEIWLTVIPINELNSDPKYQRKTNLSHVNKILQFFDLSVLGALVVGYRPSTNQYFVVDGQHRLQAIFEYNKINKNNPIIYVPCCAFYSKGTEHEAKKFYSLNWNRLRNKPIDKFHALVATGDPAYVEVDNWLKEKGFIVKSANRNDSFEFIEMVMKQYKYNFRSVKNSLLIQRLILNDNERLHHKIHAGLYYLYTHNKDIIEFVPKIQKLGGKIRLLNSINQHPNSEKGYAEAILALVNHGKIGTNKISVE